VAIPNTILLNGCLEEKQLQALCRTHDNQLTKARANSLGRSYTKIVEVITLRNVPGMEMDCRKLQDLCGL